jgi:hypothetical protein
MYLWLLLLGAVLILMPWIPKPGFGPFKKTEDAEGILRTLWQVEATALALSLAIIVFAVQAYRGSTHERYGGTLRRFIRASWLQEGYELGVVSLLLTAAVLLGAGDGGPSGSAGAVAAGFSLLSIAVLPLLLGRALHTTHRDFLQEERESRLRAAVRDEVDREVEARLALGLLNALGAEEPVALFLPLRWQLAGALGLSFLGGGMSPPEEWQLSEGASHAFAGVFEGAAAFHFREVPKNVLYVVDLSGYVTAEAWQPNEKNAVTVTVLSEDEARERAQRDPGRNEIDEAEIVRRWRETALVTATVAQTRV